ncbi:hypothetical protein PCL_06037 [Purpureocillium lilacinum]|uniref:Uncharacterized protein n=1 Tax=Purpureocillium lilacinum TaxID=33203 RepID=A0A2U3ELJ6_PURLI|nr:hypothetical protein PCL_06037 [Purpureocillium lilacinum]
MGERDFISRGEARRRGGWRSRWQILGGGPAAPQQSKEGQSRNAVRCGGAACYLVAQAAAAVVMQHAVESIQVRSGQVRFQAGREVRGRAGFGGAGLTGGGDDGDDAHGGGGDGKQGRTGSVGGERRQGGREAGFSFSGGQAAHKANDVGKRFVCAGGRRRRTDDAGLASGGADAAERRAQSAECRVQPQPGSPAQPSPAAAQRHTSRHQGQNVTPGPPTNQREGGGGTGELPPAPMRPSACGRPQKGTTHYPCLRPRRPIDEPKGRVSAATARTQPVCQCVHAQARSRKRLEGTTRAHLTTDSSQPASPSVQQTSASISTSTKPLPAPPPSPLGVPYLRAPDTSITVLSVQHSAARSQAEAPWCQQRPHPASCPPHQPSPTIPELHHSACGFSKSSPPEQRNQRPGYFTPLCFTTLLPGPSLDPSLETEPAAYGHSEPWIIAFTPARRPGETGMALPTNARRFVPAIRNQLVERLHCSLSGTSSALKEQSDATWHRAMTRRAVGREFPAEPRIAIA